MSNPILLAANSEIRGCTMGPSVMEKRKERDETVSSSHVDQKRQKLKGSYEAGGQHDPVGDKELASAFALASLASLSPTANNSVTTHMESRDADDGSTQDVYETRSPKQEPVPISPESRSPARQNKRVSFAPDSKEPIAGGIRRLSFPPRLKQPQVSRLPAGFARGPPSGRPLAHPSWMRQRLMAQAHAQAYAHAQTHASMMPPPAPVHEIQTSNQWICDFCNVAAFPTYEDACMHEESCRVRYLMFQQQHRRNPMWHPLAVNHQPSFASPYSISSPPEPRQIEVAPTKSVLPIDAQEWYHGCISLSIPESDPDWLSELNCFIRSECVEAFSAETEEDVMACKRGRIALHRVGIRCRYCKDIPKDEKEVAAVSYPLSVAGVYESVKRWQRVHLQVCKHIPLSVKDRIEHLASTNVWIPTTRQYWSDSAKALGMVDTEDGIRFSKEPAFPAPTTAPAVAAASSIKSEPKAERDTVAAEDSESSEKCSLRGGNQICDGEFIVFPEDMKLVPPYVYFLMRQVESCHFSEADRFIARSKGPVGYPGFQCRHCNGHAGLGKYFPVSAKSLATNSTSQNIHAHVLKCRKCPPQIKEQLVGLKEEKGKAPRLEPGWRRVFFDKVWSRLHG